MKKVGLVLGVEGGVIQWKVKDLGCGLPYVETIVERGYIGSVGVNVGQSKA